MKTKETAKKMAYIGTGAGVVLFAMMGLLPGSLLGGLAGLNIAGSLFGFPVSSALMPRLIVGMSMLLGILVSAVVFIAGLSSLGWLIGCAVGSLRIERTVPVEARH